jgi:hypothetical protein
MRLLNKAFSDFVGTAESIIPHSYFRCSSIDNSNLVRCFVRRAGFYGGKLVTQYSDLETCAERSLSGPPLRCHRRMTIQLLPVWSPLKLVGALIALLFRRSPGLRQMGCRCFVSSAGGVMSGACDNNLNWRGSLSW